MTRYTSGDGLEPMGPFSGSDRGDAAWVRYEFVPGFAAAIEDIVVALEDTVREPVVAQEPPDVLGRVEFGRAGRECRQGDIAGDLEDRGGLPSRPVEHDDGMGAGFDGEGDLFEMGVQRVCVGVGHDDPARLAFLRAYGGEDAGRGRSPVPGRGGARAAFRPSPGDLVLPPDAGLVPPPDFDLDTVIDPGAYLPQAFGEVFLNVAGAASSRA